MFLYFCFGMIFVLYAIEISEKKQIVFKNPYVKTVYIIDVLFLLFLIVAMGGNIGNPDSLAYVRYYNSQDLFSRDIGFGYLMKFFYGIGLDYYWFKLVIAVVGIVLINNTVKKYIGGKFRRLVYILYFIYPFFMDVVQVRNFLGMTIFIYAYPLIIENTKKSLFHYWCLIFLAGLCQKTLFLFALVPLLYVFRSNGKYIKFLVGAALSLSLLLTIKKDILIYAVKLLRNTSLTTIEGVEWFLNVNTNLGGLACCLIAVLNVGLLFFINKKLKYVKQNRKFGTKTIFAEVTLWLNVLFTAYFPLYIVQTEFFRLFRNIQILNWITIVIYFELISNHALVVKKSTKIIFNCVLTATILFTVFYAYIYGGNYFIESIIHNTFINNWILGGSE